MKMAAKTLAVFINLCAWGAGIAVLLIRLLEKNFISVFLVGGFSYSESLFFNLFLFSAGLALLGVVLCMLVDEYHKEKIVVEYPLLYAIPPALIGLVFLYFGFTGETVREKCIVIACALLYILCSAVTVYTGAKVFQTYPKDKK